MARRLQQTLADYVVLAISPALIMTLVGSLVFFLIGVFYQGDYPARLTWVMACFVFASVLIARISIEQGLERAMPFGIALAIVVGMAANKFIEFRGDWIGQFGWIINWSLIAIIWWSAHKLTWDCTMIDDSQDASGEGLLQVAGLERAPDERNQTAAPATQAVEGTTSRDVPAGWWQRYVEHQHRPHAPGVWVVYFSLAALPLYGFGQWFIPASNVGARRYAFWLLCVYVASGMSLLLTTSFLGLRRYLRQRRIEMPTPMANLWLGMGAVIIVLLLVVSAILPRPSAEYSIAELPFSVGSPGRNPSPVAPVPREGVQDEEPGSAPAQKDDDEAKAGNTTTDGEAAAQRSDGEGQGGGSKKSDEQARQSGEQADRQSQQNQSSDSKDSQPTPAETVRSRLKEFRKQQESNAQQRQAQDQRPPDDASESNPSDQQDEGRQEEDEPPQDEEPQVAKSGGDAEQQDEQQDDQQAERDEEQAAGPSEVPSSFQTPPAAGSSLGWLAGLLKWAFYAAFALAVVYFLWRYRAEVAAAFRNFLAELREFWAGLFGGRRQRGGADDAPLEIKVPPAPFSSYADPFSASVAGRYPPEELVRYSFEAFEAWSREHGCQREPDQTPHELARDVAKLNAYIRADARNMAELYSRVAYAEGELPDTTRDQLQHLWQVMRQSAAEVR